MKRTILRMACLGLLAMMCVSVRATVYTGNCGASSESEEPVSTATWSFNSETGELTITGEGALFDFNSSDSLIPWQNEGWKTADSDDGFFTTLKSVVIGEKITTIPGGYFYMEKALTTVTLPSTLTSIGMDAFGECIGLKTITVNATTPPVLGVYGDGSEAPMPESVFYENDYSDSESPAVQAIIASLEKIIVPSADAVTAYKAADGWKEYSSIIQVATVEKKDPVVTIKAAEGLEYNREEQELLSQAETSGGKLWFLVHPIKFDDIDDWDDWRWCETIPTEIIPHPYYVYYKVVGDDKTNDLPANKDQYVKVTIKPKDLSGFTVKYKTISTKLSSATYSAVDQVIDDQKNKLTEKNDYIVSYVNETRSPKQVDSEENFSYSAKSGDRYHCIITGTGNYTGEIKSEILKTGSKLGYTMNTDGTATITGLSEASDLEKSLTIYIPESLEDEAGNSRKVTSIASGAFAEGMDNIIQILSKKKLTIENGAIGKGNSVEVNPELIDEYANDPNVLEILKEGRLFAQLSADGHKLMTFSCGIDVNIPVSKELAAYGTSLGTLDIADYLQVYTCNVEKGEVIANPILSNMYDQDKKTYVLKKNNGVMIGCDYNKLEKKLDELIKDKGLGTFAPLIKSTAYQAVATLIAQYEEKKNADDVANDYGSNMLIPVLKETNFLSDKDFTYYILYEGAFHAILDNGSTTPKGKAVLKVPTDQVRDVSASRSLDITLDDDGTTAIHTAPGFVEKPGQDLWYNLHGQRISQPTKKGLYIHNGRKVVIN